MRRWWTYQEERFPVVKYGFLIFVFAVGALCHSSLLRGVQEFPAPKSAIVAFASVFLFFAILRIADEFKDFEDDTNFRPYRPVQRGLVTLNELRNVGLAFATIQLGLHLWLGSIAVFFLLFGWFYLSLMTKEFFISSWIKPRAIPYMITHMVIIPLMALTALACDWGTVAEPQIPLKAGYFLTVCLFSGFVIEIGRKIRAPEDEETGVVTYSAEWGLKRALIVLMGMMIAGGTFALLAAQAINFVLPVGVLIVIMLILGAIVAMQMAKAPSAKLSKRIEDFSGVWALALYLGLGIAPMVLQQ